jgi:hypothetical protein
MGLACAELYAKLAHQVCRQPVALEHRGAIDCFVASDHGSIRM